MTILKKPITLIQGFKKVIMEFLPNLSPWPGLPKTGNPLPLAEYDDGHTKIGLPPSGPRFTDLKDGTIFDNVTGRMWVADPRKCTPTIGDGEDAYGLTWEEALNACHDLNYAGYTDWRLPNIRELLSLYYIMEDGAHINWNFFTAYAFYYWSSTTLIAFTQSAWVTEWVYGYTYGYVKETSELLVIPIRGYPLNR